MRKNGDLEKFKEFCDNNSNVIQIENVYDRVENIAKKGENTVYNKPEGFFHKVVKLGIVY